MKVLHDAIFIPFQLMDAGQSPKTEKVSKLFPLRELRNRSSRIQN